jgi:hypothetical protein
VKTAVALLRFIWARLGDAHEIMWLTPNVVVATITAVGVSIWAAVYSVPPYLWIPLGLLTAILILFVGHLSLTLKERLARSPLEIVFDSTNPQRKFWSMIPITRVDGEPLGTQWEYRALIRNNSAKTLRNVKATVEAVGPMPTRPEPAVFDIGTFDTNRRFKLDLTPHEEALATIRRWYNPPIVPGMVIGDDMYGPIKMTASADDVPSARKFFHFNPEKTPMIWE